MQKKEYVYLQFIYNFDAVNAHWIRVWFLIQRIWIKK